MACSGVMLVLALCSEGCSGLWLVCGCGGGESCE